MSAAGDRPATAAADLPAEVVAFRARHRARHIGPRYSGWLHFGTTTAGSLAVIVAAAWMVRAPSALELLTIPLAFLFANLGEYAAHRGPMHHRRRGLGIMYERHARQHHRFYTDEAMAAESSRDFQMVLFPPFMLAGVVAGVAGPIGLGLGLAITANVGWLFASTAVAYFLTYEWLHFAYHLPPDGWVGRRRLVVWLRRHHAAHHDLRRMAHYNFNVTFPIADRLFGTVAPASTPGQVTTAPPAAIARAVERSGPAA